MKESFVAPYMRGVNWIIGKINARVFIVLVIMVYQAIIRLGRHGTLMASVLVSRSYSLGSSPGKDHCIVLLGKTLDSHSSSLHPSV